MLDCIQLHHYDSVWLLYIPIEFVKSSNCSLLASSNAMTKLCLWFMLKVAHIVVGMGTMGLIKWANVNNFVTNFLIGMYQKP